jgi:putative tricarboxylic transport membrane protein
MKADRIIVVFTVLLAAVYFYAIEQIPTLDIGDPIGPKAIPRFLGVALLVTAGLLILEMRMAAKKNQVTDTSVAENEKSEPKLVAIIVVFTALYFAAFEWLGYAIATAIYLNVLMAYFNKGKIKTNLLTATLFSFGSYFVFTKLFDTPLAPGLLPF